MGNWLGVHSLEYTKKLLGACDLNLQPVYYPTSVQSTEQSSPMLKFPRFSAVTRGVIPGFWLAPPEQCNLYNWVTTNIRLESSSVGRVPHINLQDGSSSPTLVKLFCLFQNWAKICKCVMSNKRWFFWINCNDFCLRFTLFQIWNKFRW